MISQKKILIEFYKNNPNRDISHPEVVDWVTQEYKKRTNKVSRDPDRGIRKLAQDGFLIKIAKGIYRYESNFIKDKKLEGFSQKQKNEILKRDSSKCVICGKGKKEGVELHIDHIKPKELGGRAVISNGQVLCAQHNFQKKILSQTETGKKMFIRLYELSKEEKNKSIKNFCIDILKVFEKHNINGHIAWKE